MVKLLNEDGETAGIMELEEEFCRAHSENQAILQAMPDVTKTKPANLTPDGKVKVDPEKLAKMKQQLIDLRVANARYEKQIAFVKGICDQVVESVRQELNDVETEKANFEKDLLSQLAEMARSKAAIEEDFTAKLSVSEQTIASLKRKLEMAADSPSMASTGSDVMGSSDKLAKLEKEKDELKRKAKEQENKIHELTSKLEAAKKGTSSIAANVPTQHQQDLAKLESDVRELHKKLECSEEKVTELRQTASEQKQIISTLSADLKMAESKKNCNKVRSTNGDETEITDYLDRVSNINDQTNSSMEVLDGMLKQIKALEEINENNSTYPYILSNDAQEFISLLTKSKQVREEIKMSLYLIELNFLNQLESIRLERQGTSSTGQTNLEGRDVSTSFEQKSLQIKKEVRLSLHKTEQDLLNKIASFESEIKKKEDVAKQLRKTCAEQEHAIKEARTKQKLSCSGASKILLNTLNREVHTTVEKLREKEEEVNNLNSQLDELRQELNEVIKEKDLKIETLESLTKETEEKMKILKGSFSFSDDEVSAEAPKVKPSPFFGTGHDEFYINSGFQESPDIGYF
jgi:chromosome segregation ATPase